MSVWKLSAEHSPRGELSNVSLEPRSFEVQTEARAQRVERQHLMLRENGRNRDKLRRNGSFVASELTERPPTN